jgi:hypothetical protein
MSRTTRSILTVIAALAVAAPAAQARPASEVAAPTGPQLSAGQLHRIDGPQPVALAPESPVEVAPVKAAPTADGTDLAPWGIVAIPFVLLLAFGGVRLATHKTLIPHRSTRVA